MRRLALTAALLMTVAPVAAAPALAQTPAVAPASSGLRAADVSAWLTRLGGQVGPVQTADGQTWFAVNNAGLTWAVFFNSCQGDLCQDVQFSAVVASPAVTLDVTNTWNRENRFLKAFYTAGADGKAPTATAQYDVLTVPGQGMEQLTDPLAVWLQLLPLFATHVGLTPQ
ncbi:YbjN domain-containing protein [Brevundimonas sp.]|uniref:YbjN domain-containing protein n=1 Tax=Brevundimonas sp. TaxID=1871086 RepID=UPI0025C2A655|nr:YbjN domain-containing protein [Brevundimonas sp.]